MAETPLLIAFLGVFALAACGLGAESALRSSPIGDETDVSITASSDRAGFPDYPGRSLVIAHCTGCHSGKLVQQNRASREGWQALIRWMQRKQGFWQLDAETEAIILSYLSEIYGPELDPADLRRPPLDAALLPPRRLDSRLNSLLNSRRQKGTSHESSSD